MAHKIKKKYQETLKDERWLNKRKHILYRDKYQCSTCGSKFHLNVHHLFYVDGVEPWDYPDDTLVTLCQKCHEKWHRKHGLLFRDSFGNTPQRTQRKPRSRRMPGEKKRKNKANRYKDLPSGLKKKKPTPIVPLATKQQHSNRRRKKINGEWVVVES